jgi:hypothetical protein
MTQAPRDNGISRVLACDGDYRVEHLLEEATLVWSDGSVFVGDHYGDPSCALINEAAGGCVSGGEGLVICRFEPGFPSGVDDP